VVASSTSDNSELKQLIYSITFRKLTAQVRESLSEIAAAKEEE
jgi:hypothetical protein